MLMILMRMRGSTLSLLQVMQLMLQSFSTLDGTPMASAWRTGEG